MFIYQSCTFFDVNDLTGFLPLLYFFCAKLSQCLE